MNFDRVKFVRFLNASGTLEHASRGSARRHRSDTPSYTDLSRAQFRQIPTPVLAAPARFARTSSLRRNVHDSSPLVENKKRLRALHGEWVRFDWNTTAAKLFHVFGARQARP